MCVKIKKIYRIGNEKIKLVALVGIWLNYCKYQITMTDI